MVDDWFVIFVRKMLGSDAAAMLPPGLDRPNHEHFSVLRGTEVVDVQVGQGSQWQSTFLISRVFWGFLLEAWILVERRQGSWVNSCLDDLVGVGGRGEDMSVDSQSFFFFFCFVYLSIVAVASKG